MSKRYSVAVDFDGVLHSYTTPWVNAHTIPDPPVEGAIAWLYAIGQRFDVIVGLGVGGMRTSPTGWFVFDENPADRPGPRLTGPFPTRDEALGWANLQHPDDGDGGAVVLRAEEPE